MKASEVLWGPEVWSASGWGFNGKVCVLQAVAVTICGSGTDLSYVSGLGRDDFARGVRRLRQAIGLQNFARIGEWNDAPGRTWDEIAAAIARYDELTRQEAIA